MARRAAVLLQLAAVFLAVVVASRAAGQSQDSPGKGDADSMDELIDAVASRNKEPKIVKLDKKFVHSVTRPHFEIGGHRWAYDIVDPDRVPIFGDNYDWLDQPRVCRAAQALAEKDGDRLWPALVRHIGDSRYSVTLVPPDDRVQNWSVGGVCRIIAVRDLNAYLEYDRFTERPRASTKSGNGRADEDLPDMFNWILWKQLRREDIKGWYGARKGRPLYELQIERCESIIKKFQDEKQDTQAVKNLFIEPVRKEIQVLRDTKKPILVKNPSVPFFSDASFFDAGMAKELRDDYAAQSRDVGARGDK